MEPEEEEYELETEAMSSSGTKYESFFRFYNLRIPLRRSDLKLFTSPDR